MKHYEHERLHDLAARCLRQRLFQRTGHSIRFVTPKRLPWRAIVAVAALATAAFGLSLVVAGPSLAASKALRRYVRATHGAPRVETATSPATAPLAASMLPQPFGSANESGSDSQASDALPRPVAPTTDYLLDDLRGSATYVVWTLPSRVTNTQIALLWQANGFGPALELLTALNDDRLLAKYGLRSPLPDGYILAGSYRFPKGSPARTVAALMLDEFHAATADLFADARRLYPSMSSQDVLTLASIIEQEAGTADGKRRVSSVFHNRLRRGMRLQSEPTIAYGLGNPQRSMMPSDRSAQSPYNTYVIDGIPPSPICSVSLDSIRAAVHPAETAYLFFDVGEGGKNRFSTTLAEHVGGSLADTSLP